MDKKWTIGRKNSDIVFEQKSVSKLHGILEFVDGEFFIGDLNSTNGTKIKRNESLIRVAKKVKLHPEDTIFFGDFAISFEELAKLAETKNPPEKIRCKECLKPISNQTHCPFCGSSKHLRSVT